VLPAEVLAQLNPQPGMTMLDCTLGRGGHALLIAPKLAPNGRYIGLDLDAENLSFAKARLDAINLTQPPEPPESPDQRTTLTAVHSNFANAASVLASLHVERVDLLLADLGFASNQMTDAARGLSFMNDGPLDMRLDRSSGITAATLVNEADAEELANIIYRYGEERLSRKIARIIVEKRERKPIATTLELADIVRRAYGPMAGKSRMDPATRTFMAIRIAVNGELNSLEQLLADLPRLLKTGGRAAIISFHSLEDRLVKQRFAELEKQGLGRRLTHKPIEASEDEARANPRSRSAKLRAFQWGTPDE
jgi:16S rRNA (cytosine1402-N4)-methyltransferase